MAERKSFTFFVSYWEAIEELPDRDQLPVLKAIIKYAFFGEEPNFKGVKQAVFLLVKPTLDKSKMRSANGKQGGSKTKANVKQNESKSKANAKQTLSDISEDKEKEEDKEKGEGEGEGIRRESRPRNDEEFAFFLSKYPNQLDAHSAKEAWNQLPDDLTLETIILSLNAWKQSAQWTDQGGRYIPRAAKWLREGYWKMTPAPAQRGKQDIPKGASGVLGDAELEAIRQLMAQKEE